MASETVETVKDFATSLEKIYMEKTKVLDEGAVGLRVIVGWRGENGMYCPYKPAVKVLVNGIEYREINNKSSPKPKGCKKNETKIWYSAKIRKSGIEKIQVTLVPVDGAERYFRKGKSSKRAFLPAYTKNRKERYEGEYNCPPKGQGDGKSGTDDVLPTHRIIVDVPVKRRWRFFGHYIEVDKRFKAQISE